MNVEVFKNLCRTVFPDCYIRCTDRHIPIVNAYLWQYGPCFAHFWKDRCVAWEKGETFCAKCDWTSEEFEALLKNVKVSYGM